MQPQTLSSLRPCKTQERFEKPNFSRKVVSSLQDILCPVVILPVLITCGKTDVHKTTLYQRHG
ncbi:unnamed protein product [Clavelina lepadiformis]|uniref:Uncharacterized protein n=1 Tax=Clavelina lepadiformis TaxID=159417 RepID=A0ABP0FVZ1_CLALP